MFRCKGENVKPLSNFENGFNQFPALYKTEACPLRTVFCSTRASDKINDYEMIMKTLFVHAWVQDISKAHLACEQILIRPFPKPRARR